MHHNNHVLLQSLLATAVRLCISQLQELFYMCLATMCVVHELLLACTLSLSVYSKSFSFLKNYLCHVLLTYKCLYIYYYIIGDQMIVQYNIHLCYSNMGNYIATDYNVSSTLTVPSFYMGRLGGQKGANI